MSSYFSPGKFDKSTGSNGLPHAKKQSRALVVAGGGMKGSFAGGALYALNQYVPSTFFDLIVGVSSGSCAAAYYTTGYEAGQEESLRILDIWRKELVGNKLINLLNPFKGKTILDQEYLIDYLFGAKYRLPSEYLEKKETTPFYVVVTNLAKIRAEYVRATTSNVLNLLKAATSLPIATRGKWKLEEEYFGDGGISDPIPLEKVIEAGYKDITVVLNSPKEDLSDPIPNFQGWLSYPSDKKLYHMITKVHHTMYNRAVKIMQSPPKGIKIRVIAPKISELSMVSTSARLLNRSVTRGMEAGHRAVTNLLAELSSLRNKSKIFQKLWIPTVKPDL
ncbi:phospholipase, patatin family [Leptospira fainei serovar Hurstbridge str. BUT 6]|uniref:Phospholipase, patatin family n=1 Tax=Leptospira fainei serovar Hurstbridge str. BUT 6 TaxID=1193011 RepID=S3V723_9LEPT|nr:patatin-like phospholipase family protein [Leptospira fainei]EPG76454.1 phospholipase, patatin family [Leptospira fainei serovar Hurstbridge str. BUT 6]